MHLLTLLYAVLCNKDLCNNEINVVLRLSIALDLLWYFICFLGVFLYEQILRKTLEMYLHDFIIFFSMYKKKLRKTLEMYLQDFIMFFFSMYKNTQENVRDVFTRFYHVFFLFLPCKIQIQRYRNKNKI